MGAIVGAAVGRRSRVGGRAGTGPGAGTIALGGRARGERLPKALSSVAGCTLGRSSGRRVGRGVPDRRFRRAPRLLCVWGR
jgi:hypothetical protein